MRAHRHGERGQAIVELAFTVPVLLALLAFGLWAGAVARTAIVLADAARDAARAIARGGTPAPLPDGVTMERADDATTVTIRLSTRVSAPVLGLGATIEQSATSLKEDAS